MLKEHGDWIPLGSADEQNPGEGAGSGSRTASGDASGPPLFTAIQEQLGLKLESGRAAGETTVIERAEKPQEN
jgi:uncharacterized protein (TIGR03435 family)